MSQLEQSNEHDVVTIQNPRFAGLHGIAQKLKDAGTTSRQIGEAKKFKALQWVYRWGWSTPTLVDEIVSTTRRGMAKSLVDKGYLETYFMPSAGGTKGVPRQTLCLTPKGQAFVEGRFEEEGEFINQRLHRDIPEHQISHDFIVQQATVRALSAGRIIEALSPKQFAKQSEAGVKQPDAVWVLSDGTKAAIELEMTQKDYGREEDVALLGMIKAISKSPNDGKVDMFIILSTSGAILKRCERKLVPGEVIGEWDRDKDRKWVRLRNVSVPERIKGKFMYTKIEL